MAQSTSWSTVAGDRRGRTDAKTHNTYPGYDFACAHGRRMFPHIFSPRMFTRSTRSRVVYTILGSAAAGCMVGWGLRSMALRGRALRLRALHLTCFARLRSVHIEQEVAGCDQGSLLDVERHPPSWRLQGAAALDVRARACLPACLHVCMSAVFLRARAWMGVRSRLEARWITLAANRLGEHVSRLAWAELSLSSAQLSSHSGLAARL